MANQVPLLQLIDEYEALLARRRALENDPGPAYHHAHLEESEARTKLVKRLPKDLRPVLRNGIYYAPVVTKDGHNHLQRVEVSKAVPAEQVEGEE